MSEKDKIMRGETHKSAYRDQIITHFSTKSSCVFVFFGLECADFTRQTGLNFVIAKDAQTLKREATSELKSKLRGKNVFIFCRELMSDVMVLTGFKEALKNLKAKTYFIDYGTLKYFLLIQKSERERNECAVTLPTKSGNIKDFALSDIADFCGCDAGKIAEITASFLRITARELTAKARKQTVKGAKND